jgi:CRISPR-associated protein Cas1
MVLTGIPWGTDADIGESGEMGEKITRTIPLSQIEHVVINPQVSMSGALLQALLSRGTDTTILNQKGMLGTVQPTYAPKGELRLAQYRCCCDTAWCIRQARVIVSTKIYNQAFMLKRRRNPPTAQFLQEMKQLQKLTLQAQDRAALMGIEGRATALYFQEWGKSLPPAFPFTGRTRRPPKDAVNACLSYLSALCQADILRAVVEVGLDPDLGALHSTENYRHNLVLDLMEPFRPILVEGVTRDLLTHGMLDEESTELHEDDGGCYLTTQGRIAVIRRYEQRVQSRFQQGDKHTSLRQSMHHVAVQWKQAITSPGGIASNFKLG